MREGAEAVYDVIIIGGGPAGLTAALYTARARLRTLVVDRSPAGGALARQGHIENFPGASGPASGRELLDRLRAQATGFGAEYLQATVSMVDFSGEGKQVYTTQGDPLSARAVIIATGATGWRPALARATELLGRGVSYCATCDAPLFAGQQVVVLGDTEEAFEEALALAEFAEVHLLAPTEKLWVSEELRAQAQAHPRVQFRSSVKALEILGEEQVAGLRVQSAAGEETLSVQGLFIYLQGNEPITDFLGGALATEETKCLVVDPLMHTSTEGVFAAGDVVCHRLRQVVIACGQGATAAIEATRYVAEQKRRGREGA